MSQKAFAESVLQGLGIRAKPGAVQGLLGWMKAEGGHWHNDAHYNPLNTTLNLPGAGNTGSQGNIKQYRDWGQGIEATVRTLENGRYGGILGALKAGDPHRLASEIGRSPWGTNASLVRQTISSEPALSSAALGRGSSRGSSVASRSPSILGLTTSRTVRENVVDPQAAKRVALAQHLQQTDPHSILLRLGVVSPDEPVTQTLTRKVQGMPLVQGQTNNHDSSTNGVLERLIKRADAIDTKNNAGKLPYQWGGGHEGKVNPFRASPLDCSGAVSAVLGVNPRVAAQFEKWGTPGEGKRVTIYANGTHTFMKIDGHFFGTSHANPGGGAGWIPHENMSKDYLRNFTVRHPSGM
jgi:hypothetical protein